MKKQLLAIFTAFLCVLGARSQNVNITFQVHNPDSTPVYVFGSWSGWTNWPGDAMTNTGNGYFQATLSIPASATHEFLFVEGVGPTKETLDPSWPCTNGNSQYTNRVLILGANDSTVCFDWSSCNTCVAPTPNLAVTFQVHNPASTPVYVFGNWNNWQNFPGAPMTSIGNGYYATTLYLPAFSNYEYLYCSGSTPALETLDPAWACTNGNAQYTNRVFALGGSDTTVCNEWDTCGTCFVVSTQKQATFRVQSPDSLPVYLFGNWNNWSNWPGLAMNPVGSNTYEVTIPLSSNSPYEYLFVNGVNPAKESLDPTWTCTNGNFQYTNRVLAMGSNDTTVCSIWSTCSSCSGVSVGEINGTPVRLIVRNNQLMLASTSQGTVDGITVFDSVGRQVYTVDHTVPFNSWIPVDLQAGQLYFVNVAAQSSHYTFKTISLD